MDRKKLLEMLPRLIDSMKSNGEDKIASILSALEYSIRKGNAPSPTGSSYLEELEMFSMEVLQDFPLMSAGKEIFEKLKKERRQTLPPQLEVLFAITPEPKDPKSYC